MATKKQLEPVAPAADKEKALANALSQIEKQFGKGSVMRLGENDKVMVLARTDHDDEAQTETVEAEEGDEPTAEQLAAMEAADEASASEAPSED